MRIIPKTETNMLPNEPYSAPFVLISNQQNQLQDSCNGLSMRESQTRQAVSQQQKKV